MDSSAADTKHHCSHQNVVVMRHGDRIDHSEPLWTATAARPWDPPLIEAGKIRAFCAGKKFRSQLGFPIHRVLVSPFLRCVQTAAAAVSALCAPEICPPTRWPPTALSWILLSLSITELEAMFPAGAVDHSVKPVYQELPKWEETVADTRTRYTERVKSLADKYPSENLLLVTHAEGVGVAISAFMKDITVYEVEYCANAHLKREITFGEGKSFDAGDFEVVRPLIGVSYFPLSA